MLNVIDRIMDDGIKKMIEGRREVVNRYYDLPPEELRKAETLFARMEQCGNQCRSRAEFQRKIMTMTMEREYNLMLMGFSAYIKPDMEMNR